MFNNVIEMYAPILARVRQHIPNAVLAGGCLRDTFYGVEVKDLDFVVEKKEDGRYPVHPHVLLHPWLQEVWPDKQWQWANAEMLDNYVQENNESGLLDVVKSTDDTVNFIITTNIKRYTNHFPDSISEMVFDGERVVVSQRWEEGNAAQRVYYDVGMQPNRLVKLMRKYPRYVFHRQPPEAPVDPFIWPDPLREVAI